MFLFLASALNVELVYVILKGITQFSLLGFIKQEFTSEQIKRFREMEYRVNKEGDVTITLRKYKIHDIDSWQETSGKDFFRTNVLNDRVAPRCTMAVKKKKSQKINLNGMDFSESNDIHVQEVNTKVDVTFHRLAKFAELFELTGLTFKLIEQSLSPEFNRE